MLGPLTHTAFTAFGEPTTWAEVAGFVTGVVNVWLVVRQHILNWPIGILNVVLLGLVFLDGKLYADAGLQVVYVVLQAYGWWQWVFGGEDRTTLKVGRTSAAEWRWLTAAGVLATAALTWMLSAWT